jgi:hypothetical protein
MKTHMLKYFLLFCLIFFVRLLPAQISPGDLAQVHAHLEGMSNCTKCHTLGAKVSNDKCLACHKEIKVRIDQKKGYHSSPKVYGKTCTICHSDHHGRNYDILHFDKTKFDHNTAGYKLEGAHAKQACADCHKPANIADPVLKKKKITYLGLNSECLSCHEDYHQKSLSNACANCHTNEKFKPASKFNHTKSKFQLKGKHADVTCVECHKKSVRNGKDFQQFTGIPFKNCANCHKDPHNNQFGQNCTQCHSEESFKAVKGIGNFDHSKTGYPLTGRHVIVTCKACHKVSLTTPLPHSKCTDCHTDYHKGDFKKMGVVTDCRDCHSDNGFKESNFTIEQHNNGVFRLQGAHLATPCFACHKKTNDWSFRNIGSTCSDCHQDIHAGFLNPKYYPGANCTKCHTENRWNEVAFDHAQTKFAITGAHEKQTCRSCHGKNVSEDPKIFKFTGLQQTCTSCHEDNHAGQYAVDGFTDCARCHTSNNWTLTNFDHNKTRFPLDGKHVNVACNDCHKMVDASPKPYRQYKFKDVRCENCH